MRDSIRGWALERYEDGWTEMYDPGRKRDGLECDESIGPRPAHGVAKIGLEEL